MSDESNLPVSAIDDASAPLVGNGAAPAVALSDESARLRGHAKLLREKMVGHFHLTLKENLEQLECIRCDIPELMRGLERMARAEPNPLALTPTDVAAMDDFIDQCSTEIAYAKQRLAQFEDFRFCLAHLVLSGLGLINLASTCGVVTKQELRPAEDDDDDDEDDESPPPRKERKRSA